MKWQTGGNTTVGSELANKPLTAFSVQPITDSNAITYHFAEAIAVHLRNTQPQPNANTAANQLQQTNGYGHPATGQQAYGAAGGGMQVESYGQGQQQPGVYVGGDINNVQTHGWTSAQADVCIMHVDSIAHYKLWNSL
jgi:hypothetical protein